MKLELDSTGWNKIFRLWSAGTLLFAFLAVAVVAGVLSSRMLVIENDRRALLRNLIERQVATDVVSIAEETYMGLDNLDVRLNGYKTVMSQMGDVTLDIIRSSASTTDLSRDEKISRWATPTDAADVYNQPLWIASKPLGILRVTVKWNDRPSLWSDRNTLTWIAGSMVFLVGAWIVLFQLMTRFVTLPALNEIVSLGQYRTIGQTTQMLAHDVRKPFSILRAGMSMLERAQDPAAVKRLLKQLVPEVDRALHSVNGLIQDVMEVGSTSSHVRRETTEVEAIVLAALTDVFRGMPSSNVALQYQFTHSKQVNVDPLKLGRALSNIIANAVQAMKRAEGAELLFTARDDGDFVELCIANSGSFIEKEDLPKLFDAFFTKGKKNGTGLGLAIVHKIVTAHGGRIWCTSTRTAEHPAGRVAFFLTLPTASDLHVTNPVTLPSHSSNLALPKGEVESVSSVELALEQDVIAASKRLGRRLRLLVVDDEPIYRQGIAAALAQSPELAHVVETVQAKDAGEALAAVAAMSFDVILTDVDMGCDSLDGFELTKALKTQVRRPTVLCVCSNRVVAVDHKMAIEAGADAFLPKPMARAHLLKLLLQATNQPRLGSELRTIGRA